MSFKITSSIGQPGAGGNVFKNPKFLKQTADDVPVTIESNIKSIYPLFVDDFGIGSNVIRISSGESPGGNLLRADIDYIQFDLTANVTNTSPVTGQEVTKILRVKTANAVDGVVQNTVNYGGDEIIPQGVTKTVTQSFKIDGATLMNAVVADMYCAAGFSGTVNNLSFTVVVKLL